MFTSQSLQLTLVDQSSDGNNSTVLVYQRNVLASLSEYAMAWQVIQNLGREWSHSFTYEYDVMVAVRDSHGNVSPPTKAVPGQRFLVSSTPSGNQLIDGGTVPNHTTEIWIQNVLGVGAIDACIYRSGKLLYTKTGVVPGQTAAFKFDPVIALGVVSQWDVKVGQPLNSAIMSVAQAQIPLAGLTGSATIIMGGGGVGASAVPYTFTLTS
jgi:hypothetical protein